MFCSKCGRSLPDNATVCPYCTPTQPPAGSKNNTVFQPQVFTYFHQKQFLLIAYMFYQTKIQFGSSSLDADIEKTVMGFFKRPVRHLSIPYSQFASVDYGVVWAVPGLLSGLLIAILSLVTMQLYGLIITALIVLSSYDHAVTIQLKNGTKVTLYGPKAEDNFINILRNRLT